MTLEQALRCARNRDSAVFIDVHRGVFRVVAIREERLEPLTAFGSCAEAISFLQRFAESAQA